MSKDFYMYRLECSCSSMEHNVRIILDTDDGSIFVNVNLNSYLPWYTRVWRAINYIFMPRKSKYGHYEEVILKPKDYNKIRNLLAKSEEIIKGF